MLKNLIASRNILRNMISPQIVAYSGVVSDDKPPTKKKGQREAENKITVIHADQSVSVLPFAEAEKLAKHKEMKLVKSMDSTVKSLRPVYKLMTNAQYLEEELGKRKEKKLKKSAGEQKGVKMMTISANIGTHDFQTKLKNLVNFIQKRYEVRVVISGDSTNISKSESMMEDVEKYVGVMGKTVQKRIVSSNIKFSVLPTKEATLLQEQPKREIHSDEKDGDKL